MKNEKAAVHTATIRVERVGSRAEAKPQGRGRSKISLRFRIYVLLSAIVLITFFGGMVMIWYTYKIDALLKSLITENLSAFQTAEDLKTSLISQKGFVSYYFLDGDPDWLRQLGEYRQVFKERLAAAKKSVQSDLEKVALERMEGEYRQYIALKDQVISHYREGQRETGAALHSRVRGHFFETLALLREYIDIHSERISREMRESHAQARQLRVVALLAMLLGFLLAVMLAVLLFIHVLAPVRRLAEMAGRDADCEKSSDEIKALSRSVRGLIQNVDETQTELQKSREHLLQAEKMVLVGKLAAGMAHSIRNPFTSVKMRLFSLSRSLKLNTTQQEDLDVISDEIRHIDTIVQNFLEFSRPPKLQIQLISPSAVVDSTLQILEHRLKSYDVSVSLHRREQLPPVQSDPEQLKEVLVNIFVNACEAMASGGRITVTEEKAYAPPLGKVAVIRIADNGPGVPSVIGEQIFQPFFTTKEDGTGLGLSIAARIIEEHGGWLDVTSGEGQGATFIITLPTGENHFEPHPGN